MKKGTLARSLELLRRAGYICAIVEKTIPYKFIKQDLFGFIDIVALKAGERGVLGVQSTTDGNRCKHRITLEKLPALKLWLSCGNRLTLHVWGKAKFKTKSNAWSKGSRWRAIEVPISEERLLSMAQSSEDALREKAEKEARLSMGL